MNSPTIELTPERWQRVNDVFAAALEQPADAREAYLNEACGDDPDLLHYILSLLQLEGTADITIENAVASAMNAAFNEDADSDEEMRGTRIGPYRVERLLGQGGMGMVYLALRADQQFDQEVAIKLGRRKLIDPMAQARLKAERQILANLDHPNIARLLDGGTTSDGVPYLVIEHIDGVRIDTYCDVHKLTLGERLLLFQTICHAVQYAHQNLVIHRDIKPSNILVTADGTPKLLDFGIAKLIDSEGVVNDGLTREGVAVLTPENASPEQIVGGAITTATDTYALGLLLHRLLVGLPVFDLENLTPTQFARTVLEQPVELPSRRFSIAATEIRTIDAQALAADRNQSADALIRSLRGDLDTILLKALRKEPDRRYASAQNLSDDITRYRGSMPITARPDSWHYRAQKFVQRHTLGVGLSTAAVGLLFVFAVTLFVQNQRVIAERDHAQEINRFLEDIFTAPDPANARGLDITAKEILAAGAERISGNLDDRPDIQSSLMETIGRVYYNLGQYEPSKAMLEQSLALRVQALGDDHPTVAAGKNELAEVLIRKAEYARAEVLLEEALEVNQDVYGGASTAAAENLFNLAELNLATGDLDRAQQFANVSIDAYTVAGSEYRIELAEATNALARILQVRGELDETEILLRRAIDLVESTAGGDHPLMAYYLQNLGVLLQSKGDLVAAEQMLIRAIEATRKILGEKHDLVATTLAILGSLQQGKGDFTGAEQAYREALRLDTEVRGENHPFVGYDMTSLAGLLHDKGDFDDAEAMLLRALEVYRATLDDNHQYVASTLTELGAVLTSDGRADEAIGVLERALEIRLGDYEEDHVLVAATKLEYGLALLRSGQRDEGRRMIEQNAARFADANNRRAKRAQTALQVLANDDGG